MTKYFCDICSTEIPEKHKKALFIEPGHFGAVCEMDFCDSCFRVLTSSKKIKLEATKQEPDISAMELKITDERETESTEEKPEKKPEKKPVKKPEEVKHESAIKRGRPEKEKPAPLPEPDAPEDPNSKQYIDYGKILALYRAGWKVEDIAEDVHCGRSTVYAYISKCKKAGEL